MSADPAADPRCQRDAVVKRVKDEARTKGIEATFYIAAPADAMLNLLWEPDNFPALYPAVKSVTVRARSERTLDAEFRVDAVLKELRYVIRRELDPRGRSIQWREIEGDLKRVRGGWWVEETDRPGVSKLVYRAFVDVAFFVPSRAVAAGARRKISEMVTRLREVAAEIAARDTPGAP